ncbi:MAG: hypothetical protein CHACPFDD_03710 [Phycisphaerae bacterium]|nr:hypothetical protein [Phycisphaerae bacterium]
MHRNGRTALVAALISQVSFGLAQSTLESPVGEWVPYDLDTGTLVNTDTQPRLLFASDVMLEGSAWIRLYFSDVTLGPGSFLRATSLLDGSSQELDADGVAMWSDSTAYFNGACVRLEVVAGPETSNRLLITQVAAEAARGEVADPCGICGADDRVAANQDWAGRLLPIGCTGSIYTPDSCIVTAGHCSTSGLVLQFRVPASLSNCNTVNPPVEDQFPIVARQGVNGGVGNDWAVMTTGTNNLGQKAFQRYGQLRPITNIPASVGNTATVTGFGVDSECTKSQTQQTNSGPITLRSASHYEYTIDVRGGNSGSALIFNNQIVGIVTHCSTNCPNYATRADLAAFVAGRANTCPTPCNPCDVNCDGEVNGFDIGPMVTLLDSGGTRCSTCAGDANGDGFVNGFDVDDFVACLTGG